MPPRFTTLQGLAVVAPVAMASAALAHVTLETTEAPTDGTYEAVLRVPHGCDDQPTHTVRVRIPEGSIGVTPMPEPGRKLETERRPPARAEACSGDERRAGLDEPVGSGRRLRDEHDAGFVSRGRFADLPAGRVPRFGALPERPKRAERRISVPAEGRTPSAFDDPGPARALVEPEGQDR
ncbi:MAG: DUF1775 domain-containing protein [Geminicoccaceae bacterium]|nr:DUF1775 domain-containing protein [Geminicoccaceae bacterium]